MKYIYSFMKVYDLESSLLTRQGILLLCSREPVVVAASLTFAHARGACDQLLTVVARQKINVLNKYGLVQSPFKYYNLYCAY